VGFVQKQHITLIKKF